MPLIWMLGDRLAPGRTTLDRVLIALPWLAAAAVLAWVVLALGVTIGGFGGGAGGGPSLLDVLLGLQFTLLPSVPFVLLGAAAWAWCRSRLARIVTGTTFVLLLASAVLTYPSAMTDAQGAIALIVMPVVQIGVVALAAIMLGAGHAWARRRAGAEAAVGRRDGRTAVGGS